MDKTNKQNQKQKKKMKKTKTQLYAAYKKLTSGNSLVVQWLGCHALTAEGMDSIPGWGTNIPQAVRHSQNKQTNPPPHKSNKKQTSKTSLQL